MEWNVESRKEVVTGVTNVNDGVSLDVVHVRVFEAKLHTVAVGSADNAGCDCVLQGEGTSNSYYKLSRTQVWGLA